MFFGLRLPFFPAFGACAVIFEPSALDCEACLFLYQAVRIGHSLVKIGYGPAAGAYQMDVSLPVAVEPAVLVVKFYFQYQSGPLEHFECMVYRRQAYMRIILTRFLQNAPGAWMRAFSRQDVDYLYPLFRQFKPVISQTKRKFSFFIQVDNVTLLNRNDS